MNGLIILWLVTVVMFSRLAYMFGLGCGRNKADEEWKKYYVRIPKATGMGHGVYAYFFIENKNIEQATQEITEFFDGSCIDYYSGLYNFNEGGFSE